MTGVNRLPTNIPIDIWRGDHIDLLIDMVDEDGAPVNISGYTLKATAIGEERGIEQDLSPVMVGTDQVQITVTRDDTTLMDRVSRYDIQATHDTNADERITPVQGLITIDGDVTK